MSNSSEKSDLEDFNEAHSGPVAKRSAPAAALFSDFRLSDTLLSNIREAQFENPSPVQTMAIPKALLGKDILCQAKSGTGKTAVFVLSVLQLIEDSRKPPHALQYIVVAHVKEMVDQIRDEFVRFSKGLGVRVGCAYSGDAHACGILVGTPAMVAELLRSEALDLHALRGIVVDECDVVAPGCEEIFACLPPTAQAMMFTATLTKATKAECLRLLKDPFVILVDDDSKLTLHGLRQYYLETKEREKLANLQRVAQTHQQVIVFSRSIQNALYIEKELPHARAITQKMDTGDRIRVLNEFKNREFPILSTTDILSRGIDVQDVSCVVNYDVPSDPQTYLHRVGRAGRFETPGTAIVFVNGQQDSVRLNEIMDLYEIDIEEYGAAEGGGA